MRRPPPAVAAPRAGTPALEQRHRRHAERGVQPPHEHVDDVVLAGVDEGHGHREGVGRQDGAQPRPGRRPEEDRQHHRDGRVQRRHRGDGVGVRRALLDRRVDGAAPQHAERGLHHPVDVGDLVVQGRHPGRGGGVDDVGRQRDQREGDEGREVAPEDRVRDAPEHDREDQRHQEVREVDHHREAVPPVRDAARVEVLLQPDRGHVPAEQALVHVERPEQVGARDGDPVRRVAEPPRQAEQRPADLVREAAQQVVGEQHGQERQPVAHHRPAPHRDVAADRGEQRREHPQRQPLAAGGDAGEGHEQREEDDDGEQHPPPSYPGRRVRLPPRRHERGVLGRHALQLHRHPDDDRRWLVRRTLWPCPQRCSCPSRADRPVQRGALVITGAFSLFRGRTRGS